MYTVVLHDITDPQAAFARGQQLMANEGAPQLLFSSSISLDHTQVTCLWGRLDGVASGLRRRTRNSSVNTCYPVDAEQAFSGARGACRAAGA